MRKSLSGVLLFLMLFTGTVYSQKIHIGKRIINILDNTAKAYLLSAGRPAVTVGADLTERGMISLDLGTSFDNYYVDVPVDFEYGITDGINLVGGIPLYTETYKFNGSKVSGVGDAYLGLKFKIQESEKFIHSFQFAVKIPTASTSKELGTGKADYHFGLGEGFFTGNFSYEITAEFNLLRRRDFPDTKIINKKILQSTIDSLKKYYDYKFEPEMVITISPAFDLSDEFACYAGTDFSRNFKLDYNTMELFTGLGYMFNETLTLSVGSGFGIINSGSWSVSAGINLLL